MVVPSKFVRALPPTVGACFKQWAAFLYDSVPFLMPDSKLHSYAHTERVLLHALLIGSTGDYRPLTWCDPATGRWEGFGIEIAERLAAELGVRAEFVRTSWPILALPHRSSTNHSLTAKSAY